MSELLEASIAAQLIAKNKRHHNAHKKDAPIRMLSTMLNSIDDLSNLLPLIRWGMTGAIFLSLVLTIANTAISNRLDTLRSEKSADRDLTAAEKQTLKGALIRAGSHSFHVASVMDDSEARRFALELGSVIAETPWAFDGVNRTPWGDFNGVWVVVSGTTEAISPPPGANELLAALKAANIAGVKGQTAPIGEPGAFYLIVGHNPN